MKEKARIYYDEFGDLLEVFIGKPTDCYYDNLGTEAMIRIDEKTGAIKGFMMLAFKKILKKSKSAQYDEEKDILYVRSGEPLDCLYKELGDNVFVRLDEKTKQPNGFKVYNLRKRMVKFNFYEPEKEEINIAH